MSRLIETLLFWPLPIGWLSFELFTTSTLDLIIPVVLKCHSITHFEFIVILVHAIEYLKHLRGVGSNLSNQDSNLAWKLCILLLR